MCNDYYSNAEIDNFFFYEIKPHIVVEKKLHALTGYHSVQVYAMMR